MDDPVLLSRIQFALTIGFHFLFPPISIGLAWFLVLIEGLGWRKQSAEYEGLGRFLGKLLGLTFAVGAATGIVMEFQFGTNWSEYSKFVGDIFGAPLAAEGVFAFFLESAFLGLYIFGRDRVSKPVHFFSILMVAVGATLSAFWILVANSWQQTPAGYEVVDGVARLTDFGAVVFNASMWNRFTHTMAASLITGGMFAAGTLAYAYLRSSTDRAKEAAKKGITLAAFFSLISAVLVIVPTGHESGRQVALTQPTKFAAIEGLYTTPPEGEGAPMVLFGIVKDDPPELLAEIGVPGLTSLLTYGDASAPILGLDAFPEDQHPPLWLTFVSFHNMVILGTFFVWFMALIVFLILRDWIWPRAFLRWVAIAVSLGTILPFKNRNLWQSRRVLWLMFLAIPLPLAACQFGWVAAEVGRQPYIVYPIVEDATQLKAGPDGLIRLDDSMALRTEDAATPDTTVPAEQILASMIMFGAIYILLLGVYIFLAMRELTIGPDPEQPMPRLGGGGGGPPDDGYSPPGTPFTTATTA